MQLTKTQKGLITVAVIGLAAFVAIKVAGKKKKLPTTNEGTGNPATGGVTTSNLNFSLMADDIFNAMDGYGTGVRQITTNFSMLKSDADFDALFNAYGIRTLSCGFGNPFCTDFSGNLTESLKDELSNKEIASLNKILAGNGLTKRI